MLNIVLLGWVTLGLLIGFVAPPIHDNATGLVLFTRQIAFFHVPMAVAMEVAFLTAAWNAVGWLRTRKPVYDARSLAFAEVGAFFGVIATATGSVFAKYNWGAYWSWDPQQIGILTTLLTYAALFALRGAVDDDNTRRNLWAAYAILGCLVAVFGTVVYRRILPELSTLHPRNTLLTSDPFNRFALWFNVAGYILLLVRLANLRARLELARDAIRQRSLKWA